MILRCKHINYKMLFVRSPGRNVYHFQCLSLDAGKLRALHFRIEGFLEAAEASFKTMVKPKDMFLRDMENLGKNSRRQCV